MRTHMGRSFKAVQRIGFKSELVTRLKGRIAELEAENERLKSKQVCYNCALQLKTVCDCKTGVQP